MARRTWWKVGALLAAMMMFLTMLPATALAADGDSIVYVGGVTLSGSTDSPAYATTDDNGTVTTVDASADKYNIMWDGSTLTLDGAKIKGATSSESLYATAGIYAFSNSGDVSLNIALKGVNEIFESSHGIWVFSSSSGTASLDITGENGNTLIASGSSSGILVQSNNGDATLTIQNADVTAENSSSSGDGVTVRAGSSSSASLSVDGGSLTATGKNEDCAGIRYTFGSSTSGSGMPSLTVSGNTIVRANGGISDNSGTDIQIGGDNNSSGGIVFDGNEGTVYGSVTLQDDLEIGEGESLDIPSGASLTIDSGATLTNEGTVTNSGALTNNGKIENSGTLPNNIGGNTPPSITTTSLDGGAVGTAYNATLGASGENITWTWAAVTGSSLPPGLELSTNGVISGTPTSQGTSNFTVTATNSGGSDSKQLSITISPAAPSIITQPSDQNVIEGETATFSVTATGTLTYRWQQSTDNGTTWTDIDGANAATYTIENTTAAMSGYQYRCVVTNSVGTVTSQAATLTVTAATVSVTGVTLNKTSANLTVGGTVILNATITPSDATNKNVTWSSDNTSVATVDADGKVTAAGAGTATITVTTADGNKTATCVVTVTYPYVPPRPTGPDWGDVADDISDAEPGSTVKVDMDGKTVLPGEVLDELAGRDVMLALDMGDGLIWEIYGGDVPADAEYDDVDLGVVLGGDDIPADVVNLVTGESGSVQVSLEHDGPFGFELTLVAPLGEDAAGLVANLYCYDDEAGSLGYEATAQVDGEGVARLPFDHASSWLVALDSRSHALPFPDALEGEWYSEAVRWAWLSGLMTGYGDGPSAGLFGTGDVLTRAQLAAVLYNAAGQPEVDPAGAAAFSDCDPGAWYAKAVAWAASQGLMTGYGDGSGRFGPDDGLTREQLAAVFWRAADEPAADADLSTFPDGGETSAWALEPVEWAVETGLLGGYDDTGELGPADPLERAQLAAVLMRAAQAAA